MGSWWLQNDFEVRWKWLKFLTILDTKDAETTEDKQSVHSLAKFDKMKNELYFHHVNTTEFTLEWAPYGPYVGETV